MTEANDYYALLRQSADKTKDKEWHALILWGGVFVFSLIIMPQVLPVLKGFDGHFLSGFRR